MNATKCKTCGEIILSLTKRAPKECAECAAKRREQQDAELRAAS